MPDPPKASTSVLQRIHDCLQEIEKIQDITQVPSISFGVIHEGQIIAKQSLGHRDVDKSLPPNPDTIYIIGSCSKMFLAAALGILVHEGKIKWQDKIQKHLPDFNPVGDPRIGKEADIIDCMRHTTGLTDSVGLVLGPCGTVLIDEENHVSLLNLMNTSDDQGQRFNREWDYNNSVVGLLALVIQKVTGQRYADFVRERILMPLGMTRTSVDSSDLEEDDNVADPCTILSDGSIVKALQRSWPGVSYSALVSATGMRSTINDLLTWCLAVLDAEKSEIDPLHIGMPHNPLKQVSRVRRGYWTRPADDPEFSKPSVYGMGWVGMKLPSSMLGAFGGNRHTQDAERGFHLHNILGKDLPPSSLMAIGHTGGVKGMVTTMWTFPETQSAVVVLANGRDYGDAADFTAQILVQALFDLTPRVDLVPWALKEKELVRNHFREKVAQPWISNRCSTDTMREHSIYIGRYQGFGDLLTIRITDEPDGTLSVVFNDRLGSKLPLVFYRKDIYSFFDPHEDTWKTRASWPVDYQQVLFKFGVEESADKANSLLWRWNMDLERVLFRRID